MTKRLNFSELASSLGGELKEVKLPNGGLMQEPIWTDELAQKTLGWFSDYAKSHDSIEFDGHADPWLMMAILNILRDIRVTNYIGFFDRSLVLEPFKQGGAATAEQPVEFSLTMSGNDAQLHIALSGNPDPFAMPLGDIVVPAIPKGADIFVTLEGRHYIYNFPLPLTYGADCRSMFMRAGDEFICCISNTPELKPGDRAGRS